MRVFLTHLGCKLNQAELERAARDLAAAGHQIVATLAEADLHLVNSCTVTHVAARDSRKIARRARRIDPRIRTVLTGCYVESDPEAAAALAGVDLVVPNADKERLVERIHQAFPESVPVVPALASSSRAGTAGCPSGRPPGGEAGTVGVSPLEAPALHDDLPYLPLAYGASRPLVKIEDGCNMHCSFCIIPSTRGRQRSRPAAEVVAEVGGLAAAGFPEVVLTGVQISAYRHRDDAKSDGTGLYELVRQILDETPVRRLRLTSIAPWQFDRRLLELVGDPARDRRVCRHFHLSLQSGSDATLERMRRPYTAATFAGLLAEIRAVDPATALTTDWIVGFPGETEAEFEESLRFVSRARFARVHVFPYSERPGTEAAGLPHTVAPPVVRERMRRALEVAAASRREFERDRLGETALALIERRVEARWLGTTDNYLTVAVDDAADLDRRLLPVRLLRRGERAIVARAA